MASVADTQFGAKLDLHERRYCRIYPVALTVLYLTRFLAGGGYLFFPLLFVLFNFFVPSFTPPDADVPSILSGCVDPDGCHDMSWTTETALILLGPVGLMSWVVVVWAMFDLLGSRAGIVAAVIALVVTIPGLLGLYVASSAITSSPPVLMVPIALVAMLCGAGLAAVLFLVLLGIEGMFSGFSKVGGIVLSFLLLYLLRNIGALLGSVRPVYGQVDTPVRYVAALTLVSLVLPLACYMIWILARAALTMFLVSPEESEILSDGRSGTTRSTHMLGRVIGLPAVFEFLQRPRRRFASIVMLSFVSALCLGIGVSLVFLFPWLLVVSSDCSDYGPCSKPMATNFGLFVIVLSVLLFAIGWLAERGQRRLARLSLESLQRTDTRPPVLFLRAFRDDQVRFARPKLGLFGHIMSLARRRTSLDEILLEEGTIYGPVVALGNPQDPQPPYGAARAYLDNKSWQEVVAELAGRSIAIVMCVDNTDSIWWEVRHLADKGFIGKTLFLLHPRLRNPEMNNEVTTKVLDAMGFDATDAALRAKLSTLLKKARRSAVIFGVFVDANGNLRVAQSSTFSRVAALLTLRWFLRSKFGSDPVPLPEGCIRG